MVNLLTRQLEPAAAELMRSSLLVLEKAVQQMECDDGKYTCNFYHSISN
jgi:hypothetical protein